MDIRFCDLCNQSIAKAEFEAGRALAGPEGVLCAACRGLGRPDPPTGRPLDLGLLASAVAVVVATGVGWLAVQRTEGLAARAQADRALAAMAVTEAIERFEARGDGSAETMAELRRELLGEISGLGDAQREARVRAEELESATRAQLLELEARLAELGSGLDRDDRGRELGELAAAVESLRTDVELLAGALVAGLPPGPTVAPVAASEVAAGVGEPGIERWLAGLSDPDPLARWNAVDQLARERRADLVPNLVPLLNDTDLLVRMSVARALGSLGNPVAIPALIAGLDDPEAPVREAAVVALRELTGRNFRFDPLASADDRSRRVESWRSWWERGGSEQ